MELNCENSTTDFKSTAAHQIRILDNHLSTDSYSKHSFFGLTLESPLSNWKCAWLSLIGPHGMSDRWDGVKIDGQVYLCS